MANQQLPHILQALTYTNTYGAAVDEGRELSQPVPEGLSDGGESEHDVKVSPDPGQEVGVELRLGHLRGRLAVYLLGERPHRLFVC